VMISAAPSLAWGHMTSRMWRWCGYHFGSGAWSEDEKRALVAETVVDGATVNSVARRHNINPSMLFGWRKQYREAGGFAAGSPVPIGFTPYDRWT
jgi:transposase-like protein